MASKGTKRGTTVRGVRILIDKDRLDDFEVVEAIADATDEEADDTAKLRAVVRLFRLVFGDDYARVKRELREANDGSLTTEAMLGFFTEALEAANSKN